VVVEQPAPSSYGVRFLSLQTGRQRFLESLPGWYPDEQHQAFGKTPVTTAHVERFNNTLRQRLALCYRKNVVVLGPASHLICLLLAPLQLRARCHQSMVVPTGYLLPDVPNWLEHATSRRGRCP